MTKQNGLHGYQRRYSHLATNLRDMFTLTASAFTLSLTFGMGLGANFKRHSV